MKVHDIVVFTLWPMKWHETTV